MAVERTLGVTPDVSYVHRRKHDCPARTKVSPQQLARGGPSDVEMTVEIDAKHH